MYISDEDFDALVTKAMDELPQDYLTQLDNVAILYADEPNEYQVQASQLREHSLLLGL